MGKMSKFMKHHAFGHTGGFPMHGFGPMTSDSMPCHGNGFGHTGGFPVHGFGPMGSDSMAWHGKPWKHGGHKFHKLRQFMHHMNDPNLGERVNALCSLCIHQLKAGTDIEMLACGHLFHRTCLKELIALMVGTEEEVLCTCCTQKIEPQLLESFKIRLGIAVNANTAAPDMENLRI